MTIWLDAQLPPALATWLASTFEIKCLAVRDLGLRDSDDRVIFQAARDQGDVVIMSKDGDFVERALRLGPPPRILWLTCGNVTNIHLRRILAEVLPAARPGYADFSRHPGEADFSPPRGRARATEVARPREPDESGVPKRSRAATWTLPMWPKR